MEKDIKQTWHFNQSPQEIWDYLTKPELIEQWLAKTDFKPVVGQKFQFTGSCETDDGKPHFTYCRVLEVIPYKFLSYSWKAGLSENEINVDSVVTWTLTGKNGGTELLLHHTGFTLLEDLLGHKSGWNECLDKIIKLINSSANANANA